MNEFERIYAALAKDIENRAQIIWAISELTDDEYEAIKRFIETNLETDKGGTEC